MEPQESLTSPGERRGKADRIVDRWVRWSFGAGLVPVPFFDLAAVAAVQLKMLRSLSEVYKVPFAENDGKILLTSLLGGIVPTNLAWGPLRSLVKAIPFVGPVIGMATMPLFSASSTFAVGKVFIEHFETGGTFLDFDPAKMGDYFTQQYREGRNNLLHRNQPAAATPPAGA
jgi:uncharacterized protein (DUF697 family)